MEARKPPLATGSAMMKRSLMKAFSELIYLHVDGDGVERRDNRAPCDGDVYMLISGSRNRVMLIN